MASKNEPKFRGVENHRYAVEMHALRSSGAPGPMADPRTKRQRSRNAAKQSAIRFNEKAN